jgi:uncharacterized protein (TIGR00369 family)
MDEGVRRNIEREFASQTALELLGARIERIEPGLVEIRLDRHDHLRQQNGFLHGGVAATLADTACGFAALTMASAGQGVLTVEFKINFLSPASGEWFLTRGRVKRAGRTISVCEGEVLAVRGDETKPVATLLGTFMILPKKDA